ncbi:hypothetical protein LCGC14_2971400, partial [marine sediment metagenome]
QEVTKQIVTANYLGDIEKSIWFASRLIQKARQELFNPKFEIDFMRERLEKYINRHDEIFQITFSGIKDPTNPLSTDFELQISQTDILKQDIRFWGYKKALYEKSKIYKNSKPAYIKQYVDDGANNLKAIINYLSGGKARIFILTDTGNPNLWYQYLIPQRNLNGEIYTEALKSREWLPKGPEYFDVDLNPVGSQDILILKHLMNVVLGTTDLIVIKGPGGTWNDGEMICAFNQYGFLKPHEIFSEPSGNKVYDAYKYDNFQIVITHQTATFDVTGWLNHMGLTGGSAGDFRAYINSIFGDPSNYILNFLKRYP